MPTDQHFSESEREKLAELIAIKVAEKYLVIVKEHVETTIKLHAFQCAAGKWGWFKSTLSAIMGGVMVGAILWFIKK